MQNPVETDIAYRDYVILRIIEGDKEQVKYYIQNYGYNMDEIEVILKRVVLRQNKEIAKFLLDCGAVITPRVIPPLVYMYEDILKLLFTHCDANFINETKCYNGMTYLHLAVQGHLENIVDLLIKKGADVNAKSYKKESVIQVAIKANNEKIINCLLQCDLDLNSQDKLGYTALHYAVDSLNIGFVEMLLGKGANVNIRNKEDMTPMELVITKYEFHLKEKAIGLVHKMSSDTKTIDSVSLEEELVANMAMKQKLFKIVKMLVEHGSQINSSGESTKLTPLHYAVRSGNINMVDFLIKNKANVNAVGAKDETPLNIAVAFEYEEIAEYLISNGAIVNHGLNNDMILHMAVVNKNEKLVNLLLKNNADVNVKYKSDGRTALHVAVIYESSKIIELLLENGADINESTKDGDTVLHIAAAFGYTDKCKVFMKYKPNVNKKNIFGHTPLYIAAERGSLSIVSDLLRGKPDITENKLALYYAVGHTQEHKRIVLDLVSYGFSTDIINILTPIETAVFMNKAVSNGHLGIVKRILKCGLDPSMFSSTNFQNEENLFVHAAIHSNNLGMAKLLIEHGIDVNATDRLNFTPLIYAVAKNNYEMVKLLLENDAAVNNDYRLFFTVITKGNYNIIQEFLKYYKNVNVEDEFGTTALHFAVCNGDEETVQLLFENGFKCNTIDQLPQIQFADEMKSSIKRRYGRDMLEDFEKNIVTTPLHIAARRNYSDIVEALIEQGFRVDCRDGCGRTPLHVASLFNNVGVIEVLLEFGADLKAVDESGNTCIDYAYDSSLFQSRLLLDKVYGFVYKVEFTDYETVRPSAALSLRLQIKHLALSNSRKGIAKDQVVNSYQLQDLYDTCNIEINKLKDITILNGISMYDILIGDLNSLAMYLKNEHFYGTFDQQIAINELHAYSTILTKRIRRAKERRLLLDEAEIYFTNVLCMPYLVAFNTMAFLNNRDLRHVKQTYELFFHESDSVKCKEA